MLRTDPLSFVMALFAENSARIKRFAFLRVSPRWISRRGMVGGTQGRIWGQEDALHRKFMEAASEM
jgi:hypothetical protein